MQEKLIVTSREQLNWIIAKSPADADLNYLDVSAITDMSKLFEQSHFNGNISEWDVSNVTNMCSAFANCPFNGDISKWKISMRADIQNMFTKSKVDLDKYYVSFLKS